MTIPATAAATPAAAERDETATPGTASAAGEAGSATDKPGYATNKLEYHKRLRRIEGQVRGLQRMIDEDAYCIDVLTQVSSVTRALQSVALGLLDEHVRHCVVHATPEQSEAKISEALEAIARLVKS